MLFPSQARAFTFPELQDVSFHLFLQPVDTLLVGNSILRLIKGSFEFGEFSEVKCIPLSQLIMENLICCSPQNDKLYVAGWYCCMFFGSSLPLAGLVWLLNFKERKERMQQPGNICPLQTILLCQSPVLACPVCDMQRSHHLSNVTHLHLFSKHQCSVHYFHYLLTESSFYVIGHVWPVEK